MRLKVWTPFFDLENDFRSMMERLDRKFGEAVPFAFRPITDMVRENGSLVITVELPGVDPEKDIEVLVEGDMLDIKGQKADEREVTEEDHYMHERRFGSFERKIPLPDGVDPDAIEATYDDGVLTIRVPAPMEVEAAASPKKIPVRGG